MRWFVPTVLVLALACGASRGTDQSLSQSQTFAGAAEGGEYWQQDPFVAQLPVIGVLRNGATTVVLRGFARPSRRSAILRTAARTYADFNKRFSVNKRLTRKRPVDVCVFESSAAYRQAAQAIFGRDPFFGVGFYMASHRLVLVDTSRGLGNLRHEMVHPLIKDWFPEVPAWLDEGLASLYGTAYYHRGRMTFLVNNRLRHLHRAQRIGSAPSFHDLAHSDYDDVHGPHERAYYAAGRYLLLYLERRQKLHQFIHMMRRAEPLPIKQLAILQSFADQRAFIRWSRRLRQ